MVQRHLNLPFAALTTLKVYLYYRLVLSGLLVAMFSVGAQTEVSAFASKSLFGVAAYVYFISSFVSFALLAIPKHQLTNLKIQLLFCSDIAAQLTLIHASGGAESGLGYLLIMTAAMISFFVRGQLAFGYAAFMTIAVLSDTAYLILLKTDGASNKNSIFSTGVLGALIFGATFFIHTLTEKIRIGQEEADEQTRRIRTLRDMAQQIVTRMQTGIIVVNSDLEIELINDSAKLMLGVSTESDYYNSHLPHLTRSQAMSHEWQNIIHKRQNQNKILALQPGSEIRVSVSQPQNEDDQKFIIYLEDYISIKQKAQQLKLASMGKLAARIAHEIRNPLGAISHASQLLSESEEIAAADLRMTEIIENNCKRINTIVDSTLEVSRRQEPQTDDIELKSWLARFIEDYEGNYSDQIRFECKGEQFRTKFDPTHLDQIITNLIENAGRHGYLSSESTLIEIEAGLTKTDSRPYISVKDSGPGVPPDKIDDIFEPFFTTHSKGSGLGLYICKELAEINHANLVYERQDGKTIFRIEFPHHLRIR